MKNEITNADPMGFAYAAGRHVFRALFATYFRWRVYHGERVPTTGPVILAANHASYLDPPLVGSGVRRMVHMLARDSLFRFPVFGPLLRAWRAIPVDPQGGSAAGLKAMLDRLRHGGVVLVFPEGTRTTDGRLRPARSGVGLMVLKSAAPVVPVRVWGTFESYSRSHILPRPGHFIVKYGFPMRFQELRAEAQTCSKDRLKRIYQEVADQVMAAIAVMEPCRDLTRFG